MPLTSVKSGRARAVEAALLVLREQGYSSLTMRTVADAAGMTAPALYWHYEDKDALLRDVRREVAAMFRDRLHASLREEESALRRLHAVLERFRVFATAERHCYEVLFLTPPAPGSPVRSSSMLQILVDRVSECMRRGELREADPRDVALTILAQVQGLLLLERTGRFESEEQFSAFFARSIDRLVGGLAPNRSDVA